MGESKTIDDGGHTAGPWFVSNEDGEVYSVTNHRTIAMVLQAEDFDANARLIAAAPDLLEALKEATLALDGLTKGEGVFKPIEQTIKVAQAAIAAAEGRP
jgi:hypothetical protein